MKSVTKDLLVNSLKKQLKTKPLTKVTINDIVSDCSASKQTFYNHFHDKYALFTHALLSDFVRIRSSCEGQPFEKVLFLCYSEILSEGEYYRAYIRDENADKLVFDTVSNLCSDYYTRDYLKKNNLVELPTEIKLAIAFTCAGHARLVIDWISSNYKLSPEIMAKATFDSIPAALQHIL